MMVFKIYWIFSKKNYMDVLSLTEIFTLLEEKHNEFSYSNNKHNENNLEVLSLLW